LKSKDQPTLKRLGILFLYTMSDTDHLIELPQGWFTYLTGDMGSDITIWDQDRQARVTITCIGYLGYPQVYFPTRYTIRDHHTATSRPGIYDAKTGVFVFEPKAHWHWTAWLRCRVTLMFDYPGWNDPKYYWDGSKPPTVPYAPGNAIGSPFDYKI